MTNGRDEENREKPLGLIKRSQCNNSNAERCDFNPKNDAGLFINQLLIKNCEHWFKERPS